MKKRGLSIVLTLCMLLALMPGAVLAQDETVNTILGSAAVAGEGVTSQKEDVPIVTALVPGTFRYDYVDDIYNSINAHRAANGVPALTTSPELTDLAMQRAAECALYYSHTRPNGESCFTIYYGAQEMTYDGFLSAENIAAGQSTPELVMDDWTNSPGHNQNMLSYSNRQVGVGCFQNDGILYWVQLFAGDVDEEGTRMPSLTPVQTVAKVETLRENVDAYFTQEIPDMVMWQGDSITLPILYSINRGNNWNKRMQLTPMVTIVPSELASAQADNKTGRVTLTAQAGGTGRVEISAHSNVDNPLIVPLTVRSNTLSTNLFTVDTSDETYTGSPVTKTVTSSLVLNRDYTVTYENNINAGRAKIIIQGINQYNGTLTYYFTIQKAEVTGFPSYTPIRESGKTLQDANLSAQGDSFSVPGTVQWVLDDATQVQENTRYDWLFIPEDSQNYQRLSGSILLWLPESERGKIQVLPAEHGDVLASTERAEEGETVTITVMPDAGYMIQSVSAADSNDQPVALSKNSRNEYEFIMPDDQVTIQVVFIPLPVFTDIPEDAYYQDAVDWAVVSNITNGTTLTTFGPERACTRAQVVTFLWRAAGEPKPMTTELPFEDIPEDAYYLDAILWAVENGITDGVTPTQFKPESTVTRGETVTFLWRYAGKPEPEGTGVGFDDVKEGLWYTDAVRWAVENGITNGVTKELFKPDNPCTRAQIVTFLYRQAEVNGENS